MAFRRTYRRCRNSLARLVRAFGYAWQGLIYFYRTQQNARIHAAAAVVVFALAAWLGVSRVEWAILILTVSAVMILEGVNTAIEAVVDLASPRYHPLAKTAKDVAAGMVLLASIAAVGVGVLILGVPLWGWLRSS